MGTSSAMNTSNANLKYTITVTQNSQSISNNTSNVTVSVRFYRTNTGYTTYGTGTVSCKINGTTYTASVTSDQKINSTGIVLFSKTLNIAHNSDGTKTLVTSAWINHSQFTSSEQSYSQVLSTIPRATTPVLSNSSPTIGTSITITLNRASTSFTHTLTYTFGTLSGTIGTGIATYRTWTVPSSFANQIPSGTSGTGTIVCQTYNGSTLIGSKTVSFTANLSSSDVPTINSVTITEATEGIATKFGAFIQNKSKLNVAINASPSSGASISTYLTYIQALAYNQQSFTSGLIYTAGNIGVNVTVTDSRGKTKNQNNTVSVLDYSSPTITTLKAYRANSSGTATDDGTYLKVEFNFAITALNNLNDKSYKIEYKATSSTSWTTLSSGSVYSADSSVISSSGILNTDTAYDVRLTVTDYFGSTVANVSVSTAFTLMDFRSTGKGMAIGKVSEKDRLEIAMDTDMTGNMRIYAPTEAGTDDGFLRFIKKNGNLLGFLSTFANGHSIKLTMYDDTSGTNVYSGYLTINSRGGIHSNENISAAGNLIVTGNGSIGGNLDVNGAIGTDKKPTFMDWGISRGVDGSGNIRTEHSVTFRTDSYGNSIFSSIPYIVVTPLQSYAGANHFIVVNVTNRSTTGFTAKTKDIIASGGEYGSDLMWFAIGILEI